MSKQREAWERINGPERNAQIAVELRERLFHQQLLNALRNPTPELLRALEAAGQAAHELAAREAK